MSTLSQGLLNDVRIISLRCFAAVVETRSFSSAARQLRLSASSVTKHVRTLESSLGVALVHRTTRQVSVTEAGEHLYRSCQAVLVQIDNAAGPLVGENRLEGHLRIVAPPAFAATILGPAMPHFLAEHPRLTVDVFVSSSTPDLIRERLDLAITLREDQESKQPHLQLGAIARVLCASPTYLAQRGAPRRIEDLQQHDIVASRFTQRADVWELRAGGRFRTARIRPRLLSDNGELQKQACLHGAGIGAFYDFHVRRDLTEGRLVRVLPQHETRPHKLYVALPHREIVRPQARAFIEFLQGTIAGA
jgi:DNA-binding transcriptional LysR family regulator